MTNAAQLLPTPATQTEPPKPTRARIVKALRDKHRAEGMALHAERGRDRIERLCRQHDAEQVAKLADDGLNRWYYTTANAERGNGGELVPVPEPEQPERRMVKKSFVQEPAGMLEHDASSHAMDLAANVEALTLALDMANAVKARNRMERLLAHQAAAFHKHSLDLMARAQKELERVDRHAAGGNTQLRQVASVEAARLTNASARAASSMNEALLTLQKLRTGGKQVVKVKHVHQHVQVNDGGEAVVAGGIRTGRKGGGSRRGQGPNG